MVARSPKRPDDARVVKLPAIVHEVRGPRFGRLRIRYGLGASAERLKEALDRVEGVNQVRVSTLSRSIIVVYDSGTAVRSAILHCFTRSPPDDATDLAGRAPALAPKDAVTAALWGAGIVVAVLPFLPLALKRILVVATVAPTAWRGLRSLLTRGVTVELLDAIAVTIPALSGKPGTAAATNLFLRFAAYVEERASERSDDLVRSLLRTTPETVRVAVDEHEELRPYVSVRVGDRVVVMPGEVVPVDGEVVAGEAVIDSSAITGESIPIPVEKGAAIKSGVMLLDGRLEITAERVGDATTVARIRTFIERALAERSTFQRVADRMADRRAWVTLGTAASVYAMTGSFARIESISLVDFSCTTKLGTAVAIKGTLYRAGRHGVLVKGGDALDALASADTVVFDKTGTLTTGQLYVEDVVSLDSEWPEERLLALAASLAEHTTHPVATSVVDAVKARGLKHISHEEVDFMVGHGLSSQVDGTEVLLGSRHFLVDHKRVELDQVEARIAELDSSGTTALYLAQDRRALGAITLREDARDEAPAVLKRLRRLGIRRAIMLTGDRRAYAQRLASALALDEVHAEIEPRDKAAIVHELRADGRRVVFVGDGVNDGPALMAADVGIAMPRAADIARATADVVLLDDRLSGVAEAIAMSQRMMAHLRTTLNVAAGVNTAILFAAATGRMSPLLASILHNGTTLGVLGASWAGNK